MRAHRQYRVANDNGREVDLLATRPLPAPRPALPEPVPAPKPGMSLRWVAIAYQFLALGLVGLGMAQGMNPLVVATLATLSALGGFCAVKGWVPTGWLSALSREALVVFAAVTLIVTTLIVAPGYLPRGLQDPLILSGLVLSGVAAFGSSRIAGILAVGAMSLLAITDPLWSLPLYASIQIGCIVALCAVAAWKTRSTPLVLMTVGLAFALLWSGVSHAELHLAQGFGVVALAAAALAMVLRDVMPAISRIGWSLLIASALALQLVITDAASADALLQSTARNLSLSAFLVALQGSVLGVSLLRWMSGRTSFAGVILPLLVMAGASTLIIDPTLLERAVPVPGVTDIPALLSAFAGVVVASLSAFALFRSWQADNPVRTALYAMILIVQTALLWPLATLSLDMTVALFAALGVGGLCMLACRPAARPTLS